MKLSKKQIRRDIERWEEDESKIQKAPRNRRTFEILSNDEDYCKIMAEARTIFETSDALAILCKQLIQPVPSNPCLWILGASLTTREHQDHIPDKTPPPQFHFGLVRIAVPTSQAIRSQMAKQPWLHNGTSSTPCWLGIIERSRHTQTTACIAVRSLVCSAKF